MRALPVLHLPGFSRPLVRRADFEALVEENTYRPGEQGVPPVRRS